ncbi:hypothetical protein TNCV_2451451 [Trichonephila clavipes]|nr:hypothetical protein TNCV_2451451 [Trichonephila clavipes]
MAQLSNLTIPMGGQCHTDLMCVSHSTRWNFSDIRLKLMTFEPTTQQCRLRMIDYNYSETAVINSSSKECKNPRIEYASYE